MQQSRISWLTLTIGGSEPPSFAPQDEPPAPRWPEAAPTGVATSAGAPGLLPLVFTLLPAPIARMRTQGLSPRPL